MGTQQFIIDGHSGIFPTGYNYQPYTVIPSDAAAIFGSLGGACLLFTNGFDLNIPIKNLSCNGLAWVSYFLGDHPLADHVQSILDDRVADVYILYDAIVGYATMEGSSRVPLILFAIGELKVITIPIDDGDVSDIFTKAVNAFIQEVGVIDDVLRGYVRPEHRGLMCKKGLPKDMIKNLVTIGKTMGNH
jgi:hypothetical protein